MAAEASEPQVGDVVDGRYELESIIGAGGMGQVWSARDRQLESVCAVKFILGHMAQDKHVRGRFEREAKAVAALRTAHVVQVFGRGEHRGVPYIAMELLEGETLRGRLSRDGSLDAKTTLAIIEQAVHALDRARAAQIVHRDLKPENIWLSTEREVFVKILDFGVAKAELTTSSLQTVTGALLGTPYYMSPEQALGKTAVDYRSDLWALAIIAVECLSGKRPFESESLSELLINICTSSPPPVALLAPQLPPGLQAFWERGLARQPENRFQSGGELLEALRRGLSEQPVAAPPPSAGRAPASTARSAVSVTPLSSTRSGRRARSWPRHLVAGTLGVAVTAGLVITAMRVLGGADTPPGRAAAARAEVEVPKPAPEPAGAAGSKPPVPAPASDELPAHAPVIRPVAPEDPKSDEEPVQQRGEATGERDRAAATPPRQPSPAGHGSGQSTLTDDIAALAGTPPPPKVTPPPPQTPRPEAAPPKPRPPATTETAPSRSKSGSGRELGI